MLNTEYKFEEVHDLKAQIQAANDKVQFHPILSNDNGGVVLLAFKAGQKLDTHTAPAEVMVCVLEGEVKFNLPEKANVIKGGEFMLLGFGVAHSVEALADSKVALIKIKA